MHRFWGFARLKMEATRIVELQPRRGLNRAVITPPHTHTLAIYLSCPRYLVFNWNKKTKQKNKQKTESENDGVLRWEQM